ncbi:MAG TPA: hypothetical protein VGQ65_01820 [Thermoanaerobaculia bacterium]|nr:hypothetical protein [Thermoanaerobaculia bacterium]
MLRRRAELLRATVVAVALLAALPSFAVGRDLTTVRIATADYSAERTLACTTEKGFPLRRDPALLPYGTTADAEGVPRLPASSVFPASPKFASEFLRKRASAP